MLQVAVVAADHVLYERWGFTPSGGIYSRSEEVGARGRCLGSDQGTTLLLSGTPVQVADAAKPR